MLAQWKSDGLITRKSLDRNEDMLFFFCHVPDYDVIVMIDHAFITEPSRVDQWLHTILLLFSEARGWASLVEQLMKFGP